MTAPVTVSSVCHDALRYTWAFVSCFLQARTESGILNVLKMRQMTMSQDFLGFQ